MESDTVLDAVDRTILAGLQADGRRAVKTLAADAGIAASTCAERIRGLLARGIIRGFRADVDLRRLGRGEEAVVGVRVRPHSREIADTLVADLLALPEVLRVMHVAGPDDFLVHVAVPDTSALGDFVLDRLTARREVAAVATYLIFGQWERRDQAPLPVTASTRRR